MAERPLVTILAPAYDEADNAVGLVGFYREIRREHPDLDFELLVVDDGSTDGTGDVVLAALRAGDVARVARLSRNFGSHAAVSAGLALARGDCVITVSTDLQEPMDAICAFLAEWRAGADVVWGVRRTRAERAGTARLFSRLFHRWSDIPTYPKDGPSQVLLSRQVIDVVCGMPERNRNVLGMIAWVGFTQRTIEFDQLPRPAGHSKWTARRKLKLVLDSFVEFCPAPFLATTAGGLCLAAVGLLAGLTQVLLGVPSGWGMVLAAVCFVGGLQLGAIGGFGEYLWRAGDDARQRPVYVLRGVQDVGVPGDRLARRAVVTGGRRCGTRGGEVADGEHQARRHRERRRADRAERGRQHSGDHHIAQTGAGWQQEHQQARVQGDRHRAGAQQQTGAGQQPQVHAVEQVREHGGAEHPADHRPAQRCRQRRPAQQPQHARRTPRQHPRL